MAEAGLGRYTEEIVHQWRKTWSQKDLLGMVEACGEDKVLLPFLLKYLPKDAPVLECGCGLGQWVVYLGRQGYRMAGVDLVPDCLDVCRGFFPEVELRVADVRKLPYADGRFGGYVSIGVLEHMIEGPASSIDEMRRVLKPGGVGIILVPAYNYLMRAWYPLRRILVDLLRENAALRKLLGKPGYSGDRTESRRKLQDIRAQLQPEFWASIGVDPEKGPIFIEYKYKKGSLENWMRSRGLEVVETVPVTHPYVFKDLFGSLFLKEAPDPHGVELNAPGRLLDGLFRALSPHLFNYSYICVVRKGAAA